MSQKVTVTEGAYVTRHEAVAGALDNKEDSLVSLNNVGKVVLFDGSAPAFGVFVSKLQAGETACRIRVLGKNGTVRVIQHTAITPGVRVKGNNANARVITADASARSLGFKLSDTAGAVGDVIEICDVIETIPEA